MTQGGEIFMEDLKAICEMVTALAAVTGVILAWRGLQTWREQLKGTSEYQLAKETLKAAYRVQETFRSVRKKVYIDKRSSDYDERLVREYERRNSKVERAYVILKERCLDAKIEWGEEFYKVQSIMMICYSIYSGCAFNMILFGKLSDEVDEGGNGRKVVLEGEKDEDGKNSFTEQIDNGAADFERFLRPIIDKKSSSFYKRLCRPFRAWKKKKG
jgi:hypothetical protein